MDSFIKVVEQKKERVVYTIHTKRIELIRRYIREGKNVFICGPPGVGKTYILKAVLEGYSHVELQSEHLKSKSLFLPFIKPSCKHVFIEDYDPVFKPIIERVSDGNRLTRGSFDVTCEEVGGRGLSPTRRGDVVVVACVTCYSYGRVGRAT